MSTISRDTIPDARKLSVLAYELNSLALAAAAQAESLARHGLPGGACEDGGRLAEQIDDLIRSLQAGTRAMRVARRRAMAQG